MAGRIGGTLFIAYNGTRIPVRGSWEVCTGRPKREGVVGSDLAVHGFTEKGVVPYFEGEASIPAELDIQGIQELQNATISADLANGWTAVLRGAWHAGDNVLETEDGKTKLRFEGLSMDLSTSAA